MVAIGNTIFIAVSLGCSSSSEHLHMINHQFKQDVGLFLVFQGLQRCLPSVYTLEVMLNSYMSLPPCEWAASLPAHVYQVGCPFCS